MLENIFTITKQNKNYPKLLKKIKNPPEKLYILGQIFPQELCVAIVGARRCSAYGRQVAFDLAFGLAKVGVTVVSGLAPGIDTLAHEGALLAKGRTIAVLGTGLAKKSIYPQSNVKLAEKIIEQGGALISEYPPETHGSKITFPKRNRIIAGLSLGVVVVEGTKKSGSLITAKLAFKEKRKVFAVPGQISNKLSEAPNLLLKKGALLVENYQDILKALKIKLKELNLVRPGLTFDNDNILVKILAEQSPLHLDEIIERSHLPAQKVIAILSQLELEGKVQNLGAKIYSLVPYL